jgi:hypothetical protein
MRVVLVKNIDLGGEMALSNGTMGRIVGWRGIDEVGREMEEGRARAVDALKVAEAARAGSEESHGEGVQGEGAQVEGVQEERERVYYECKRNVEALCRGIEWLREQVHDWEAKSLPIVRC